jgi:hypothetical protein
MQNNIHRANWMTFRITFTEHVYNTGHTKNATDFIYQTLFHKRGHEYGGTNFMQNIKDVIKT